MLACWVEDPKGDYFKRHLARISDYIWVAEDGMKMQVCFPSYLTSNKSCDKTNIVTMQMVQGLASQTWDASLMVQALLASNLVDEIGSTLYKAHDFIKKSQVNNYLFSNSNLFIISFWFTFLISSTIDLQCT